MNLQLIGNSLVRGIQPRGFEQTLCFPGAGWDECFEYVMDHKDQFKEMFLYVLVGPLVMTGKNQITKEVTLQFSQPRVSYQSVIKQLYEQFTVVVLCPFTPMDFAWYNGGNRQAEFQHLYTPMTEFLTKACIEMNCSITDANNDNGVLTPYTSKEVLRRKSGRSAVALRGAPYYIFRRAGLTDGLHYTETTKQKIAHELYRCACLNLHKVIERWDGEAAAGQ